MKNLCVCLPGPPTAPAGSTLWFHQVHPQMGRGRIDAEWASPGDTQDVPVGQADVASFSATDLRAALNLRGIAMRQSTQDPLPSLPCSGPHAAPAPLKVTEYMG